MQQIHFSKTKNSNSRTKMFDKVVVAMGVINLAATLPQVLEIWVGKDASGVSSLSWGYYSLFTLVLLIYGIVHKQRPIVATYSGALVLYMAIFVGSIVY